MSFTLRIIFYGLVAVVPTTDEQSIRVILIDAPAAHQGLSAHQPTLWLLEGKCRSGKCYSLDPLNAALQAEGSTEPLVPKELSQAGFDLVWSLHGLELGLPHLETTTEGRRLRFRPGQRNTNQPFPGLSLFSGDADDVAWIPAMEMFTQSPSINSACLDPNVNGCPISARVDIEGNGLVRACHHLHYGTDHVRSFRYVQSNGMVFSKPSAIADTFVAEFEVEGNSLELDAEMLQGSSHEGASALKATVNAFPPNGNSGKITLVVANLPLSQVQRLESEPTEMKMAAPHFWAYYGLLKFPLPDGWKLSPQYYSDSPSDKSGVANLSCEKNLIMFEKKLAGIERDFNVGILSIPHNKAECDAMQFPAQ